MSDHFTFLRALARSPSGVGAIAPSSTGLARQLVDSAEIGPSHHVVELGAGTGPMTVELSRRVDPSHLLVLEPDAALARRCRARVPGLDVVEARAESLPELIEARGWPSVDRVVSSLPFASFPPSVQDAVFDAVLQVLAPGGRFVTFTYAQSPWLPSGRRARKLLDYRFERVGRSPMVWRNVPPAFVYVCDTA